MTTEKTELQLNVEKALEEVRPFLRSDGGDVTLLSIKNNIVNIRFEGACNSCNVNQMTLKSGIEMTVKKYAPQIEKVVSIVD